jgi:hypothetical protein
VENVGSQSDGGGRDAELAGCDGIDCRHVCDGKPRPARVGGVRRIVGEECRIAVSEKNVCSAGVRMR